MCEARRRRWVALSGSGVVALLALVAPGLAHARDCAPQAQVVGPDVGEVRRLVAHLRALGVTAWADGAVDEGEWGCPEAVVKVGRRNDQLRLIVRDPSGQTYRRDVGQYATAAVLVESWLRSSEALPPPPPVFRATAWWIRAGVGVAAGDGEDWGIGPSVGGSRALLGPLRLDVDARAALGPLEVPTVAFALQAERPREVVVHSMLDLTAGLSAVTRSALAVGLGMAGGVRMMGGGIEDVVPLFEGKALLLVPVGDQTRIELSVVVHTLRAYGLRGGPQTQVGTRLGVGFVWGLE